ncbi:hypothetical protein BDV10DRAFT_187235 [Aspergillus recurvatus]
MRNFTFCLFLLVGICFGPVAAFGPRAAAEEMSYWYMYVLEGEVGSTRTVAPGCAAWAAKDSGAGLLDPSDESRCSLKGFLKYIWAPKVGTDKKTEKTIYLDSKNKQYKNADGSVMSLDDILANERPDYNVRKLKGNQAWRSVTLSKVYEMIYESKYVDGADPDRLLPGSGGDYWAARSRVTAALPAIEAQYPEDDSKPRAYQNMRTLIAQTKRASEAAYRVRLRDFEHYRIGQGLLQQKLHLRLGTDVDIVTRKVDTYIDSLGEFNALDAAATVTENTGIADFDTALTEVCEEYREADKNHWTALNSARQAVEAGHCKLPEGVTLKRSIV